MSDNNLRISFDYKYPDEAVLVAYSVFGGGYLGGESTINIRKVITGEEAVKLYSKLTGKTVEDVKKEAGYPKEQKEEKISELEWQLSIAGDRRDWDECERLEKEIDKLNEETKNES